jgi:uncharacterized protein involved in outer membrane biogenesis
LIRVNTRSAPAPLRVLVLGIFLGLLTAALYVAAFDWNLLTGPIKHLLSSATGRRLEVGGRVSVNWHPQMRLRFEDVRIANPDWAQAPYLLTADAAEVEIDWTELIWSRRLHMRSLELINATVVLERNARGRATWHFDRQQNDRTTTPRIDTLKFGVAALAYLDVRDRTLLAVVLNDTPGDKDMLRFTVRGQFRGEFVDLSGSTVPLLKLGQNTGKIPLSVHGIVAGTPIEIDGEFPDPGTNLDRLDPRFRVRGRGVIGLTPASARAQTNSPGSALY